MKYLILLALLGSGYFAFVRLKPKALAPAPPAAREEAVPILTEAEQAKIVRSANDLDAGVRWESIALLHKMKAPTVLPIIFDKIRKDADPELKVKIIGLLAEHKGRDVSQHLLWAAARDISPEVRIAALQSLEKIGDGANAAAIAESLKDTEDNVRLQAIRTLNALQDKREAATLAAEKKRQEEQREAAEAQKKIWQQ